MTEDKSAGWKGIVQKLAAATKDTLPDVVCMIPGIGPMVGGTAKVVLYAADRLFEEDVKEEELGKELVKRGLVDEEKLEKARQEILNYADQKIKSVDDQKHLLYMTSVGFYTGENGPLYLEDVRMLRRLTNHEMDESEFSADQVKWYNAAEDFMAEYEVDPSGCRCGYHWLEMDFICDEAAYEYDEQAVQHMMNVLNHILGENKFFRYEIAGTDEDNGLN